MKPIAVVLASFLFAAIAQAEGTYEIQRGSGSSAIVHMESTVPGETAGYDLNMPRITYLKVDILNSNEVIDIYSSIASNSIDAAVWCPGNAPTYANHRNDTATANATFNIRTNAGRAGYITSWSDVVAVQAIAGRPRSPVTYTPSGSCGTGTYTVRLYANGNGTTADAIEYFDVAVRDTRGTGSIGDDILRRGRLFSYDWEMIVEDFSTPIALRTYVVAGDDNGSQYIGYVWEADSSGIQPFGFHAYANRYGAGPSAHHGKSIAQSASPTPAIEPGFPMYLNPPAKSVVRPPENPRMSGLYFNATCAGAMPNGGTFQFNTNDVWNYALYADRNNDGIYTEDEAILRGIASKGFNIAAWNGKYQDGTSVVSGTAMKVRARVTAGEVHFPYYDVENQDSAAGPTISPHSFTPTTSSGKYYWNDKAIGGVATMIDGSTTRHLWTDIGNIAVVDTWKFVESDFREHAFVYGNGCVGRVVSGFVYRDDNTNGIQDAADPGLANVVVVLSGGASYCSAVQTSSTGAYRFDPVPAGSYTLKTIAQTWPVTGCAQVAANPVGYVDTSPVSQSVSVNGPDVESKNFGKFAGGKIEGWVFDDHGGSTSNAAWMGNGVRNPGEPGISNALVHVGSTVTAADGDGKFHSYVPAGSVAVVISVPAGHDAISRSGPGNSGGDKSQASFTVTAGQSVTGVLFGLLRRPVLSGSASQTLYPGAVAAFIHQIHGYAAYTLTADVLVAGSSGISSWPVGFYRDADCDQQIDPGEGVLASIASTPGMVTCAIVRVSVPSNAVDGEVMTLTPRLQYSVQGLARPEVITSDILQISRSIAAGLVLIKTVNKSMVAPGDTLTYTIVYRNLGSGPLSNIRIFDATPAYTKFQLAGCLAPLPTGITGCTVSQQPSIGGTGPVQWQVSGSLASGAEGRTVLTVAVEQ